MKSKTQTAAGREYGAPMLRLLGIAAAAALAALLWMAAGASAQTPSISVAAGWLSDAASDIQTAAIAVPLDIEETATGAASDPATASWTCTNFECHYLTVAWSGIHPRPEAQEDAAKTPAFTISIARNREPTAEAIGASPVDFETLTVATRMSLPVPDSEATTAYVPVPWDGERVTVTVSGDEKQVVETALRIPASSFSFSDRDALSSGSTLVEEPVAGELPMVLTVWRRAEGATHYEVQYTFRTRSSNEDLRLTQVTRIVTASQITDKQGSSSQYARFKADWDQHPNADLLNGLEDSAFGDTGQTDGYGRWMGAVTTLPKLLAGAEHWPQTEGDATASAVREALGAGQNAVGVRVRPVRACGADQDYPPSDPAHVGCATDAHHTGVRAVRGKLSKVSYVRFAGDDLEAWVDSAGTAR